MAALTHSGLMGVAMTIELVAGALLLAGLIVPAALCLVMPVSTCALYWSVILDHQPLVAILAIAAFALNGFLMLAYLDYYRGALQRQALTVGESAAGRSCFSLLFVNPNGRTSRPQFAAALIPVLIVVAFYAFLVRGLTAHWCLLMLVFPAVILQARRLHDMGQSSWLLLVPTLLTLASFAIWLHVVSFGAPLDTDLPIAAAVVVIGFALWGCVGGGQAETNRFGSPVAA
jgi:uncharacterized membrane protein YhaH (DUF805 family)